MNSTEFQTAIQNRYVVPKSVIQLSAFFQKEYPPEEMVKVMNHGTNGAQYLDKQKNGLNIWKYSCNTMTSGYIYCIVDDNPASTGTRSDKMEIPEWLKNVAMHAVSGFLIGFCSAFVANPSPSIPDLGNAIYGAAVIGLYGAVKEVAAYVESMTKAKTTMAGNGEVKPLSKRML